MADQESFPVGQAPWEQGRSSDPHPDTFPVGKAPWETTPAGSDGVLSEIGRGAAAVGNALDSVTGAPTRAAISAAQHGKNPISAFAGQFAEDPSLAPSGHDIAKYAGLSDSPIASFTGNDVASAVGKIPGIGGTVARVAQAVLPDSVLNRTYRPSPADIGGAGITLAADPLNLIPGVAETDAGEKLAAAGVRAAEAGGNALKDAAEHAAVSATGATASQAAKFGENAGRELLDRGVVKFGDNQSKIAERAASQMENANSEISSSLKTLQNQGVTVKASDVESALNERISALKSDPSNADIVKRLQNEIDNLKATGKAEFGIHDAEMIKRGYNRKAGNWADPESAMAGKEAYQAWRGAVEDAATAANPELAKQFTQAKEAYGTLAPIQESAARRALVQQQAPIGDFRDLITGEMAERAGGPVTAIPAIVARHVVVPRIGSAAAVTLDKFGNAVKAAPEIAAPIIKSLPAAEGASALSGAGAFVPAAVSDQPTKGPDKWANDGLQKLLNHASGKDKAGLQKSTGAMLSDPKLKDLLIQASDVNAGSKSMEKILSKVKEQLAQQGED